ncbi:hypothetical protein [Olivibacter sitiensis]|uniref:hypothetical protein n=1 Tax=Olivibacter sitiensis TaxID=376470 RepID=UPI00040E1410|nr:hypothetical protein [Olivibacter sitiensis]
MKSKYVAIVLVVLLAACKTKQRQQEEALIRDCPEEKIVNKMPMVREKDSDTEPSSYFIYKGQRRELAEFDLKWVEQNCQVKETVVH